MDDKRSISFSIRKAAQLTGVGETTLRSWIKRGLLPVTEIGGKRLIKRTDLEGLLDRHQRR